VCLSVATNSLKRVLEVTSPDESDCQKLYQELAEVDLYSAFERSVQSERCLGLWAFDMLHSHPESLPGFLDTGQAAVLQLSTRLGPLGTPMTKLDEVCYLQAMARQVAIAKVRGRAPVAALSEADGRFPWYAWMSRALLPALERARDRRDKTLTGLALAQSGLALNVYHARTGQFPASLSEVEKTVGWALPKDPFTGSDLVYQPRGDGYLLYSFGVNGRDDRGQSTEDRAHRTPSQNSQDDREQNADAPARRTPSRDAQDDIAWWFGL
jgi:hypothetical protein